MFVCQLLDVHKNIKMIALLIGSDFFLSLGERTIFNLDRMKKNDLFDV